MVSLIRNTTRGIIGNKLYCRVDATNICHPRSALSACAVAGLPNINEYTYADRDLLLEERRLFSRGKLALNVMHYRGNELTYR